MSTRPVEKQIASLLGDACEIGRELLSYWERFHATDHHH